MGVVKRYSNDREAAEDLKSSHLAVREHARQYFRNLESEHRAMMQGLACRHGVTTGLSCAQCDGREPERPHCSRCAGEGDRNGS